jgi:DNA-binding transcriptional MerR regulator
MKLLPGSPGDGGASRRSTRSAVARTPGRRSRYQSRRHARSSASSHTGLAPSVLRFYEAESLIRARRSGGGQRRFHRDVLRRIAFVRVAQRVGLTIHEIRAALATCPTSAHPPRRTGRACRAPGGRASTSRSRPSSACATG